MTPRPTLPSCFILAHDTEADLAQLLHSEHYRDSEIRKYWEGLFPFLYGKSLEELAAQKEGALDFVICPHDG